jgi:Terminase large subunit, T4likevirus-type, N-terminal
MQTYRRQIHDLRAQIARQPRPRAPYTLNAAELFERTIGAAPDAWQAQLLGSDAHQTLLSCSRQSGKSTGMAVLGVDTMLARRNALVIVTSGSIRQAAELLRTMTQIHAAVDVGARCIARSATRIELANGSRAIALPTSAATIRGYSKAALVLCDEAAYQPDILYRSLRPMLAVSGGRIVLGSTPFGRRGFFYQEWSEGDDWQRISVPATDCPRIPPAFLEAERKSMGEAWYSQEYLNVFLENMFAVFSYESVMAALSDDVIPLSMRREFEWQATPLA